MPEQKTRQTKESVAKFLDSIEDERKRKDSYSISQLMEETTGYDPVMWGSSIVGFGKYHYKYDSGHEGDCALVSFSPRKQNITIYLMAGFDGQEDLLKRLGKHKIGKGCLYINKLEDIDQSVLKDLIKNTIYILQKRYEGV